MKRTSKTKELKLEIMVGGFMFAALVGLCIFTILLSRENWFQTTYPMEVVFDNVMGLRNGDNVASRGMVCGKVKSMVFAEDGVHVQLALYYPITLRSDYRMDIIPTSVLGGRYVQIDAGESAELLPPDTVLRGNKPNDLVAVAAAVAADLKAITEQINTGQGTLGKLIYDDALYNDAHEVVAEIKASVKERGLLKNLENSVANLNEISEKINSGVGTIGKLVNDDALYDDARGVVAEVRAAIDERGLLSNIEGAAANLNEVAEKINSGVGTLGKLVNDDSLYDQATATIVEVRAAVDDLRETSPITTFSSIFFGAF